MNTTAIFNRARLVRALIGGVLAMGILSCDAAIAPRSEAGLKKEARHILTGTVVGVISKTRKSKVEKAKGIHRDRVFTIRLKVTAVTKGEGVKAGEEIVVAAWQPSLRIPPLPGPQGHESIPDTGDQVTLYLKAKKGAVYEPVLPNGITIIEAPGGE